MMLGIHYAIMMILSLNPEYGDSPSHQKQFSRKFRHAHQIGLPLMAHHADASPFPSQTQLSHSVPPESHHSTLHCGQAFLVNHLLRLPAYFPLPIGTGIGAVNRLLRSKQALFRQHLQDHSLVPNDRPSLRTAGDARRLRAVDAMGDCIGDEPRCGPRACQQNRRCSARPAGRCLPFRNCGHTHAVLRGICDLVMANGSVAK